MFKLAATDTNKNLNLKMHLNHFIEKLGDDTKNNDDYVLKKKLANFKYILSKVLKNIYLENIENKTINSIDIFKTLEESLRLTKEVISKLRDLKNEQAVKEEKEILSDICYEIGKYYEGIESNIDFSEKAYLEAFNNCQSNDK
jgi:hypothetical protein